MKRLLFLCILPLILISCKEDTPIDNLAPDTRIFLDKIELTGTDRLNSVVSMHWSGEDKDGYVKGYELSLDEVQWKFVTVQDSTFRFDIMAGSDTTDIDFWVRSIDNKSLADPEPAFLRIPIKNTPPIALLDTLKPIQDTVLSVFSILWAIDDLDGLETLDSSFIRLNDGPWYPIDLRFNFITLIPEAPEVAGTQGVKLLAGPEAEPQSELLQGLRVGEQNRFYVRAKDIAGTFSEIDTSDAFFVRRKTSDLLVIDSHSSVAAEETYDMILGNVYPTFDLFDINKNFPPFLDPTIGVLLGLYDKVFWYSDGSPQPDHGNQILLEIAANQLQEYLNGGGKLLVTTQFPVSMTSPESNGISPIFDFSPMDSLSSSSGQARIPTDSMLVPTSGFVLDYPLLTADAFTTGADPFYPKDTLNVIYTAQVTRIGGWIGPVSVGARSLFTNGKTNQVFFSVELHKMGGNPAAREQVIDQILNKEFDW